MRGVLEPLDLEERPANLISDSLVPRLVPELELIPWRRSHVVAVQVHASPVRPHYLRREGPDAGVYVRVGSTNRKADRELIEELRRFARGEAYDEQPCRISTLKRSTSEQLQSCSRRFDGFAVWTCRRCAS